jgi:hypothetical protein
MYILDDFFPPSHLVTLVVSRKHVWNLVPNFFQLAQPENVVHTKNYESGIDSHCRLFYLASIFLTKNDVGYHFCSAHWHRRNHVYDFYGWHTITRYLNGWRYTYMYALLPTGSQYNLTGKLMYLCNLQTPHILHTIWKEQFPIPTLLASLSHRDAMDCPC